MQNILVIKLSAIGDFIQATGTIKDIRAAYPNARITLLTTKLLKALVEPNPYIDDVVYHTRPKWWDVKTWWQLRSFLRSFDRTYDLQCNDRTQLYYQLSRPKKWCGTGWGCAFHQRRCVRKGQHSSVFLPEQLRLTGVPAVSKPDVSYAAADASAKLKDAGLKPNKFVVLIPGSSAAWPGKRWSYYASLAKLLQQEGWQVALCGGPDEGELLNTIAAESGAINLQGFSLPEFMDVFANAAHVVGNDTGPMHMAAACGVSGAVLFGPASNYKLHAPKADEIKILHNEESIDKIQVSAVMQALKALKAEK